MEASSELRRLLRLLRVAVSAPLQLFMTTTSEYTGRSLNNKVCVLTGGSSGIGLAVAEELTKRGCDVILLVRDRKKSASVVAQLAQLNNLFLDQPHAEIRAVECDLSNLVSVRMAVLEVREHTKGRKIDFLCCTAGVFLQPSKAGSQARASSSEMHYGINHIGHFALLLGLLDVLRASSTRVVMLSSDLLVLEDDCSPRGPPALAYFAAKTGGGSSGSGSGTPRPHPADSLAALWRSLRAFAASKLASLGVALELRRRFPELGVVSVHPGHLNSHTRHAAPYTGVLGAFWGLLKSLLLVSDERAGQCVLHCLLSESVPSGAFWQTALGPIPQTSWFLPPCVLSAVWRRNLWDESLRIVRPAEGGL